MSKQISYWIYLFPAVMDFSLVGLGVFSTVKAINLGAGPVALGLLGTAWGTGYALTSLGLVQLSDVARADFFMKGSAFAFIVLAIGMTLAGSTGMLIFLSWLTGISCAFFFIGFQLSMSQLARLSTAASVAAYNLSWSLGFACGSLAESFLFSHGSLVAVSPVIFGSFLVIGGLQLIEKKKNLGKIIPEIEAGKNQRGNSPFLQMGWTGLAAVAFLGAGFRYLFPEISIRYFSLPLRETGLLFFLFFLMQSIVGLFLHRRFSWQYQLWPLVGNGVLGIAGCLLAIVLGGKPGLVAFVILLGLYSGYGFFYGVFYSLDSYQCGRNISVNESIVGLTGIVGPLMMGLTLKKGFAGYLGVCAVIIFSAVVWQVLLGPSRKIRAGGRNDCGDEARLQ
ncbi:MAG: MFS transporter [Candidatus Omnitrophica bacterium]|nr:MFS transporter [Candidatus Omnitrophota bacterium]